MPKEIKNVAEPHASLLIHPLQVPHQTVRLSVTGVALREKMQLFREEKHFCLIVLPQGQQSRVFHHMVLLLTGFDHAHIKFATFQVQHELKSQLCFRVSGLCWLVQSALRKHVPACNLVVNGMTSGRSNFTELSALTRV